MNGFYAVVPAGGSGTRLWPLSTRQRPKFLHNLVHPDRSLLQTTVDRLSHLTTPDRIYIATGQLHAHAVAEQLPRLPAGNLLTEPEPRDSCAAIGLAAAVIAARDPDAIMGSFAADHHVTDTAAFTSAVHTAIGAAATGALVAIGLTPTRPETGYGYLHTTGGGAVRAVALPRLRSVTRTRF